MKRTLLILCALLAMAYSAGTQAQNVWNGTVAENFAGGNGTAEDPYQIADGAQLAKLAQDVNGGNNYAGTYFVLTADILLNDTTNWKTWDESTEGLNSWTPIGSYEQQFTGTLDGDGHSVSGIYINSEADFQGLVGYNGGTLQNLGVKASYIKGGGYVGGLCGSNSGTVSNCYNSATVIGYEDIIGGVCGTNNNGDLTNCYNTGKIEGSKSYVGGVCGYNFYSTMTNCYNTGSVTGYSNIGGLCGYNMWGTVTNCYNSGDITGVDIHISGMCGLNDGGTVTNCYNAGNVTGNSQVGGLCGYNKQGTVTNCYNTGSIADGSDAGGVCGRTWSGTVTNCYYLNTCGATGVGTSKTADEFQSGEVAWLLQNGQTEQVWGQNLTFDPKDSYPVLGGLKVVQNEDGTSYKNELKQDGDFYLISNADELRLFASMVNSGQTSIKGRLTADILLNDTEGWETWGSTAPANTWTPIGSDANPFTGTLDGDGHSVSGIYINSEADFQGLVGYNGGTLQNLGVKASYIKGGGYVGGLCGRNGGGTVNNCYNTGNVTGSIDVGGVCGANPGNMSNCYNTGSVTGDSSVGGVCGRNEMGTNMSNCYNSGSVTGDSGVGGVCGSNLYSNVTNCYNSGTVAGNNYVGGVCGYNESTVANCYYLTGTANSGIGSGSGEATAKTADEFASGEVAWLLQGEQAEQVWGQTIGTDEYPVWQTEGNKVYKLTLQNGEEANALYANSGNFTLPAPVEVTGYTFAGWFTTLTDGEQMQDNAELTADLTLYAQWTANSYTVTFEANGGEGSMNQQTFTYDVAQALNQNTFTRTGYSFTGWNTQADGNGSTYGDEAEILNLTTEANGSITLYAQWSINSYTIRFVNADGTELQSSEVEYGQRPAYNGETPTKESTAEFDYAFAGWDPEIDIVTGDATYTATYTETRRSYTITFVDEDGTTVLQSSEVEYGQTPAYNGETPTKESTAEFDYAFAGWDPEIDIVTGEATYTATYTETRRSYTITLALAEGCEEMGEVSGGGSYEYGTQVTITATANEGYTFVQWSDGDTNATRTITVTGDLTLTATFTATDPSALHSPEAGTWKAIGTDGMLRITGTEAEMTVYDMRGALVYRGNARTIHVTAGAYIVRIGNEVQKAIVK